MLIFDLFFAIIYIIYQVNKTTINRYPQSLLWGIKYKSIKKQPRFKRDCFLNNTNFLIKTGYG